MVKDKLLEAEEELVVLVTLTDSVWLIVAF